METYQIKIEKLDHQGRGIGYHDKKIVFVPSALPDEEVLVHTTKEKKNWKEAQLCRILDASQKRIVPACPYYNECGGCDLMHMGDQEQLEFKANKVKELVHRYGDLDPSLVTSVIPSEEQLFYRNKTTFQVNHEIGFYEKNSNTLIPISECMISDHRTNQILKKIKEQIPFYGIKQVVVRTSKKTQDMMVIFDVNQPLVWEEIVSVLKNDVTSILERNDRNYKRIYGKETMEEVIDGKSFFITPDAFFQVNTKQAELLYQQVIDVCELKGSETILDLYCGTGSIGLSIAPYVKNVIGVEVNEQAIESAILNQQKNHITNIEFLCGKVEKIISNLSIKPDIVIVDPPRSGLDHVTKQSILEMHPQKIVYVSCDPMTLARDLKELSASYKVKKIIPVDLFPQTEHVECVCVLNRR